MPELTTTSSATSDSIVSTQATVPISGDMDAEAAQSPGGTSGNISTISSASGSSERLNHPGAGGLNPQPGVAAAPTTAGVAAPMPALFSPAACGKPSRDSSWLELDICRDFQKDSCPRSDQCRFAHPDSNVVNTRDGKVTCCYDFLKDRCYRERCKYFHPPPHIKERLVTAGKQYGAMMSNMYSMAGGGLYPATVPMPGHPVVGFDGCLVTTPPPPAAAAASISPAFVLSPYGTLTERLHVCPEFHRGQCSVELCPFAHPEFHVRQNFDSTVTMCRDFIRTGCQREHCRYFHPPQHIMAQVENIVSLQAMAPPQGLFIAPSPLMSPPTSMGFQPAGPMMFTTPHPSFSIASPIPASSLPLYQGGLMRGVVPSLTPYTAAVPMSVITTNRPSPARGYSHHFPMTNVVSVQSISTQPTTFVQPPILSPISPDAVNGRQVGAAQMPSLAIA